MVTFYKLHTITGQFRGCGKISLKNVSENLILYFKNGIGFFLSGNRKSDPLNPQRFPANYD